MRRSTASILADNSILTVTVAPGAVSSACDTRVALSWGPSVSLGS
jgi:hypothetical protein